MRVKVERYNGQDEILETETFDSVDIAQQMNSSEILGIAIGNQVFSRIDIKHAKVIEEEVIV
jgi:hypothetical protein